MSPLSPLDIAREDTVGRSSGSRPHADGSDAACRVHGASGRMVAEVGVFS